MARFGKSAAKGKRRPTAKARKTEPVYVDTYALATARGDALRGRMPEADLDAPRVREVLRRMMWITAHDPHSRGLSAPQIGERSRMFVLRLSDGSVSAWVNPQIKIAASALRVPEQEGCFSMPGQRVRVRRAVRCTLIGRDADGVERSVELNGIDARAAQHEMDHLDGKLISDHGPVEEIPDPHVGR